MVSVPTKADYVAEAPRSPGHVEPITVQKLSHELDPSAKSSQVGFLYLFSFSCMKFFQWNYFSDFFFLVHL